MKKSAFRRLTHLTLIAFVIIVAGSCQKGDDGTASPTDNTTEYYISFKANGVQKKYTSQALASLQYVTQDKLYSAVLQGYQNYTSSSSAAHLGIIIFNNSAVTTNAYQDPQKATNADGSKVPKVSISYQDDAGNGFLSMGLMVDENGQFPSLPGFEDVVADAKVSITKLTSTYIEGTFSATTYLSTDTSFKTKIVISEGKFVLKQLQ